MTHRSDQPLTSSARRSRVGIGGRIAAGLGALIVLVVVVLELTRDQPEAPPTPPPSPTPTVTALPLPSPTPTEIPLVEHSSPWVEVIAPSPTPTWWPTVAAPVRRVPTATPAVTSCVHYRWGAGQSAAAWGQVLIEIEVINRCSVPLEPNQIWFQVAGYRDGALVQTARGHPFRQIFPGRSEDFSIGLPGSIDWYDRITVELVE
jgi:hypothetical protein